MEHILLWEPYMEQNPKEKGKNFYKFICSISFLHLHLAW